MSGHEGGMLPMELGDLLHDLKSELTEGSTDAWEERLDWLYDEFIHVCGW